MDQNETNRAEPDSIQTVTSEVNEVPLMPAHTAPASNRRRIGIVIASIVVILILFGGLYYALGSKEPTKYTNQSNTDTTEVKTEPSNDTELVVNSIQKMMQGDLQKVDSVTEHGGTGIADGVVFVAAAYQSGDQEFAVYPVKPTGFGTTSSAEIAKSDHDTIISHLTSHDFKEVTPDSGIYSSGSSVCVVTLFTKESNGFDGTGLGCADNSSYDSNYQTILPFFTAYKASNPVSTENLVFSSPKIADGVDGYKNAYINIGSSAVDSVGGFAGLFYFTPSTNQWTYFTGSQSDLLCDLFNTATLKKAFSGRQCIDPSTNQATTVKAE